MRGTASGRAVAPLPQDTAGVNLVLKAAGGSGTKTQATFVRRGAITIDRFYRQGERTRIKAVGFGPKELVTVEVNDGRGHAPVTALSDENGQVTADLNLLPDEPGALIVATSHDSLLTPVWRYLRYLRTSLR